MAQQKIQSDRKRISDLEDKSIEITQSREQKEKKNEGK